MLVYLHPMFAFQPREVTSSHENAKRLLMDVLAFVQETNCQIFMAKLQVLNAASVNNSNTFPKPRHFHFKRVEVLHKSVHDLLFAAFVGIRHHQKTSAYFTHWLGARYETARSQASLRFGVLRLER